MNLPPFYIGERVIGVEPNPLGFPVKNAHYRIRAVKKSPCCGLWLCAVEGCYEGSGYTHTRCTCGRYHDDMLFLTTRFRPLEEKPFPLITLSKIAEKEKQEILIAN